MWHSPAFSQTGCPVLTITTPLITYPHQCGSKPTPALSSCLQAPQHLLPQPRYSYMLPTISLCLSHNGYRLWTWMFTPLPTNWSCLSLQNTNRPMTIKKRWILYVNADDQLRPYECGITPQQGISVLTLCEKCLCSLMCKVFSYHLYLFQLLTDAYCYTKWYWKWHWASWACVNLI